MHNYSKTIMVCYSIPKPEDVNDSQENEAIEIYIVFQKSSPFCFSQ